MIGGASDRPSNPTKANHVLVVDDDELVRTVICEILERVHCTVSVAANGSVALKEMACNKADLVILDIIMPEKEGLDTLLQLKRDYPDVKVIAISSGGRRHVDDFLVIAQRFGADAVLKKPIKASTLLSYASGLLWGGQTSADQADLKPKRL